MKVGERVLVSGCITKEKFIAGRRLADIERILGFHPGRLAEGIAVVALAQLPELDQFDLAGYSNVATHRHTPPTGFDFDKLKQNARATWALGGVERLVKVLPAVRHNPSMDLDSQYPPGLGVPQWIAKKENPQWGTVVAVVTGYPNEIYRAVPR